MRRDFNKIFCPLLAADYANYKISRRNLLLSRERERAGRSKNRVIQSQPISRHDRPVPATMKDMSEPVTRAELEAVLTKFAERMESRLAEMRTELTEVRTELTEMHAKIERVETSLLTAFHGWARPTEIKFRASNAKVEAFGIQISGFDERVNLLEERMADVERQLRERHPPAA